MAPNHVLEDALSDRVEAVLATGLSDCQTLSIRNRASHNLGENGGVGFPSHLRSLRGYDEPEILRNLKPLNLSHRS